MGPGGKLLGTALLGAANVLNGVKPIRRRGAGGVASFLAGWPTSEMPIHLLGVHSLVAGHLVRRGALKTRSGRAGLTLAALGWAGLVGFELQKRKTAVVMAEVLRGLPLDPGDDDRTKSESRKSSIRAHVAPGLGDTSCRVIRNVSYGDHGKFNLLDIWIPKDLPQGAKAPVLVQVHGGGWTAGTKNGQAIALMGHMAANGWICVSVNYRLSPKATWPDLIVDVKQAIAWTKANIAAHGGDPSFVAITGGSAGGHLAALAALSANDPAFQPGFEDDDTTLAAAVPFYGVYNLTDPDVMPPDTTRFLERLVFKTRVSDDPRLWEAASPDARVGPDAPPFLVIHGANDSLVPVEEAHVFVEALRARSERAVFYAQLPGVQHAFDVLASPRTQVVARGVHRFLESVRSGTV